MPMKTIAQARLKRSFIEEHRRRQLIDTAIEVIAGQGLSQASLANIAAKAGVSKGIIAYYFNTKDELVEQIMSFLMHDLQDYIRGRLESTKNGSEKLHAYVSAFFEFAKAHRDKYAAFIELWTSISSQAESNPFGSVSYEQCRSYIGKILRDGQKLGEFSAVDVKTMSALIQGMIDGVIIQWLLDPALVDIDTCHKKVLELIDNYLKSIVRD